MIPFRCLRHARGSLVGLLLVATVLASCARPRPEPATPTLWRIGGPEGQRGHLLGSVHLGPSEGWPFPAEVERAFAEASVLVVEVDDGEAEIQRAELLTREFGLLSPGERLDDMLSEEAAVRLRAALEARGIRPDGFMSLAPWLAAVTLVQIEAQRSGYGPESGVDRQLIERARGRMEIVPLETAEQQIRMLAGLSIDDQLALLTDALDTLEKGPEEIEAIIQAWREGDDARLERLVYGEEEAVEEPSAFHEEVYVDRNVHMASGLSRTLSRGEPVFAVIGAGHLVGPRSVPELLRDLGFEVERTRDD